MSSLPFFLQFIREYTGKVDELIKEKIEALNEVKAKEKEEKDVIAQQVFALRTIIPFDAVVKHNTFMIYLLLYQNLVYKIIFRCG